MTYENQERKYEDERICMVLREIDNKLFKLGHDSGGLKKDVIYLKKTFWDDEKINLDNPEDAGETLSSIRQQAELLSERERTHLQLDK